MSKDLFSNPLMFGELLGLTFKKDEKRRAMLKKMLRILVFCCMAPPFSTGCYYIIYNITNVGNVTQTLVPMSSLGFCILRYFRFIHKGAVLGNLVECLRKSTAEGLLKAITS